MRYIKISFQYLINIKFIIEIFYILLVLSIQNPIYTLSLQCISIWSLNFYWIALDLHLNFVKFTVIKQASYTQIVPHKSFQKL